MSYDRKYLVWALGYVVVGMCLGIFMAATQDHGQRVTHAHINLVGFLLSFGYGIIHKLWLRQPNPTISRVQFIAHQAGSTAMFIGLFLLYGNVVPGAQIDPILGIASITVLVGALLMFYMALKDNAVKT
jgi:hypothetical protein